MTETPDVASLPPVDLVEVAPNTLADAVYETVACPGYDDEDEEA
jgi:hypothetical protein